MSARDLVRAYGLSGTETRRHAALTAQKQNQEDIIFFDGSVWQKEKSGLTERASRIDVLAAQAIVSELNGNEGFMTADQLSQIAIAGSNVVVFSERSEVGEISYTAVVPQTKDRQQVETIEKLLLSLHEGRPILDEFGNAMDRGHILEFLENITFGFKMDAQGEISLS